MRWLDKLERHLGFLAIPNLIMVVIGGQIITTLLALKVPDLASQLVLDPELVMGGEWWRLLTWVIMPSTGRLGPIFAIFWFQILLIIGRSLEAEWGHFKSTVYLLLGIALPALSSMLLWQFFGIPVLQNGLYFTITLQLAFAALEPDFTIMLMFILPVRMRWVAWFLAAWLTWIAVSGGPWGPVIVLTGVANYLLFFAPAGWQAWRQRRLAKAGRAIFVQAGREAAKVGQRACVTCGRGPNDAELRLCTCSDCGEDGRFFCIDDLKTHLSMP